MFKISNKDTRTTSNQPIFGLYGGDNLTHSTLFNAFYNLIFDPRVAGRLVRGVRSKSPAAQNTYLTGRKFLLVILQKIL